MSEEHAGYWAHLTIQSKCKHVGQDVESECCPICELEQANTRIAELEAALHEIFLLSGVDGNNLSDAIDIAGRSLGPNKV